MREASRVGPVAGLILVATWAPMLTVLGRFPSLDRQASVHAYWYELGDLTLLVIAAVSVGYPFMLMFLIDLRRRWVCDGVASFVTAQATFVLMVMFLTSLNIALGLAAAGGLLILAGDAAEVGYGLHVAAYVLAAPATGMGPGACAGLFIGAWWGHLGPRWLRWPALATLLGNLGTLGGLFRLEGVWNSGNGLLGGIALPLGTIVIFVAAASCAWLREASAARTA